MTDAAPAADGGSAAPAAPAGDGGDDLPRHEVELSNAVNRLGNLVVAHRIDPARAAAITAAIDDLADEVGAWPEASKAERLMARNRITTFLETGRWPPAPPDGSPIEFDPASLVGGELNPFAMGARYFRDGDEAVGRVTLGPCYEGPPDRVHGGVICAVFDEVLGCVFRATGTASGFTGELTVRFEAPAPLGVELEFRGRLVGSKGRRQFLEGEATGPDGRFASAAATFVQMTAQQLAASGDR
jgi:acyl-coenzyme A thioesterase PaaI-like protein